jgi:hypothetical protein
MRHRIWAALALAAGLCTGAAPSALAAPPAATPFSAHSDKLFLAREGVAFSQFPSSSRLVDVVGVGVTRAGTSAQWTAKSDAAWLTVTASGDTGQTLRLVADPQGLGPDAFYAATVTVRTTASSAFQDTERIQVGLWVGSTDPQTVTVTQNATSIAANPVLPLAYVTDGGSTIQVYDVYGGTLKRSFQNVAPTLGQMVPSDDGTRLFAVDTTNYRIVELDAKTGKALAHFALQGPVASDFSFAYARPGGFETLFAAGQPAINVATGKVVSNAVTTPYGFYDPLITASADGTRLAVVERGLDPGTLYTWDVTPKKDHLLVTLRQNGVTIEGENCQAMAMSSDGTRLYTACGWPYQFDVYDWGTLQQVQTLVAATYPNNAVFDSDNDFVGGLDGLYDAYDVYVFDKRGFLVSQVATTAESYNNGQADNAMAVSGDSMRVISVTDWVFNNVQTLMFRNLH